MTTTLIIIGIFAGFFFLVVRPLQKRSGKYDVELKKDSLAYPNVDAMIHRDPGYPESGDSSHF